MAFSLFKRNRVTAAAIDYSNETERTDAPGWEATSLGHMIELVVHKLKKKEALWFEGRSYSYQELDEQANRVANGLVSLGIAKGDRVAIMLPNIPEFAFSFFGIQKLGAIAVPFNTMYKGREIIHILNDSGAKAIITMTNFGNLINEIKSDVPNLEHLILTGQRTLVFAQPDASANVQVVCEKNDLGNSDDAFRTIGEIIVETLKSFGVKDAWYRHQGAVRAAGKKIATIVISEIEGLYVVNAVCFLADLDTDAFFRVVWVPAEVKDKVLEPMTSVKTETGALPSLDQFREVFLKHFEARLGVRTEEGKLKRDELFGYEKNRAMAYKV